MKRSPMRKVSCPDCGYTIRMARSWMTIGMPSCPCGAEMRPESPADLAYLGLIGPEDMSSAAWTAICRENGWEDAIIRKGNAAKRHADRTRLTARRTAPAAQCAFTGCGRWVRHGEQHCEAHRALEPVPF